MIKNSTILFISSPLRLMERKKPESVRYMQNKMAWFESKKTQQLFVNSKSQLEFAI
jgi:hypothetical protein